MDTVRRASVLLVGLICAMLSGALVPAARAEALGVDWKFYGGAETGDGQTECFFDAAGIAKEPDGVMRIWTKCLLQKDVESVDIKKDYNGQIVTNATRKFLETYIPPLAKVESLDSDVAMNIIAAEQTADIAAIEPVSRILYQVNCSGKMMRELSIYVKSGGKVGFVEKPSNWKYVSPESNGGRLLGILCSPR